MGSGLSIKFKFSFKVNTKGVMIIKIEINDRVQIISECNSKGQTGVVINTYYAGYSRHCKYVMVYLENGIKQGYNQRSVIKISDEKNRRYVMEGFKYVAIVNLLDDYSKKDYGFALYETERLELKGDDLVVVNARGKNNRILGVVKETVTVDEYGKGVTAQVVGVVNMSGYIVREEEQKRKEEIKKERAAIEKELESKVRKLKDMEFYEKMAKEYSDKDPELMELVLKLKSIEM